MRFFWTDIESKILLSQEKKNALSHGSSPRSFSPPGHLLAVFVVAYGSITANYVADSINKNTASIEVLTEVLVVVGPELANKIVDLRERCGEFKSTEALDDGGGIGPSLLITSELKIRN